MARRPYRAHYVVKKKKEKKATNIIPQKKRTGT